MMSAFLMSSKREAPLGFFLGLTAGFAVAFAAIFGLGLTGGLALDFAAGLTVTFVFGLTGDLALDFAAGFVAFPAMKGPQQRE